jgi:formiminotetrahydrofolate cyclodeaminase
MKIANSSLRDYLEKLASSAPTPGGGSASAIAGSMAAALVAMMGRLTLNRKDPEYQLVAPEMGEITRRADHLREELLELADRDTAAFDQVMAAYRLARSTESEQAKRQQAIQEALKEATDVPHRIAAACEAVLELAQRVAAKGVRSAVSDAGTAAALAEAGLHSALLNVDINLKSIQDEKYRHLYHKKCTDLAKQARVRKDAILAIVEDWIRPE